MYKTGWYEWVVALIVVAAGASMARAADWPAWRHDSRRSAVAAESLPDGLHLQWTLVLPVPRPAWPASQTKLRFDDAYEPIVAGGLLVVGSSTDDSVQAFDVATGANRWRFETDGPVRFAPVAADGRVYVTSDDGFLYCLGLSDGSLLWKHRGGPSARTLLGNDRLTSAWPARGAPVVHEGRVYFAAGIWPFTGIFLHALDARTGAVVWSNTSSGSVFIQQQHSSPAFAGVAPQGYLAVAEDLLLVSGGRTVPAAYDLADGAFRYFEVSSRKFGKDAGGYEVGVAGDVFFNGGAVYEATTGKGVVRCPAAVLEEDTVYGLQDGALVAWRWAENSQSGSETKGRGKPKARGPELVQQWAFETPRPLRRLFLKAGARLYAACDDNTVVAVAAPANGSAGRVVGEYRVEAEPLRAIAAADRLFVSTREGRIYCFGAGKLAEPSVISAPEPANRPAPRPQGQLPFESADIEAGWCVVLGLDDGAAIVDLAREEKLSVIAVGREQAKVVALRERLRSAGLHSREAHVLQGDPSTFPLPPYLADLVVCLEPAAEGMAEQIARILRPCGGVAFLPKEAGATEQVRAKAAALGLSRGPAAPGQGWIALQREGSPTGSGDWTHQYADPANTVFSRDRLVRPPLGLLWFGGPSNDEILPRHGHGPTPQVLDGRLFIEGRDLLRCMDIYTGRLLWERRLEDLGRFYDNTSHQPGANEIGSNYVTCRDGVYVARGRECLRLDPATGRTISSFVLPEEDGEAPLQWGFLTASGDLLIATASPMLVPAARGDPPDSSPASVVASLGEVPGVSLDTPYASTSKKVFVLDRHSGKVLWRREAQHGFRHNTIVIGGGKLFCLDRMSDLQLEYLRRRGYEMSGDGLLCALDSRSGEVIWSRPDSVSGTWLSYSEEFDVLLEGGSASRDRAADESRRGMAVLRGSDGSVVWEDPDFRHTGPCILVHDAFFTNGSGGGEAYELLTGRPKMKPHPLTGEPIHWKFSRHYGCNTAIGSEHMLLFRSAAAGFFDLSGAGATGNMGGFKSGCTSNLIPAGGVLSAPDYTRTCTCSYQNQTSLAMIHRPDADMWTFSRYPWSGERIRRVGINFGAPGDRTAPDGVLWLDTPSVGGPSPEVPVVIEPDSADCFRHHSSLLSGPLNWVAGSGILGARKVTIPLARGENAKREQSYRVRLVFAEPLSRPSARRVFDVLLQGRTVLRGFDPVREAGGPRRAAVQDFSGIRAGAEMTVELRSVHGQTVLCGVELSAED